MWLRMPPRNLDSVAITFVFELDVLAFQYFMGPRHRKEWSRICALQSGPPAPMGPMSTTDPEGLDKVSFLIASVDMLIMLNAYVTNVS